MKKFTIKNKTVLSLLSLLILAGCGGSGSSNSSTNTSSTEAVIDVLVLYDKSVGSAYSNVAARVHHLFAVSNNIYKASQLPVKINVKSILFYDAQTYPALEEIAESSKVKALRKEYKADTVLIYQLYSDDQPGLCGSAYSALAYDYQYQFKEGMYAQVAINCPADATAHELGHNMGLAHSHRQDGDNVKPYPYGLGHGVDEKFSTMMAYPFIFNTNRLILKFSSPHYECIPGYPCGIPIGQEGEAHATKVIEITAPKIADLY